MAANPKAVAGTVPTVKLLINGQFVESKAREFRDTAESKAREFRGRAEQTYGDTAARVRTFQEDTEAYIRENPLKAVATGIAAGFVLGVLFRR